MCCHPPASSWGPVLDDAALTPSPPAAAWAAPSLLELEVHLPLLALSSSVSCLFPASTASAVGGLTFRQRCLAEPLEEMKVRLRFPNVSAFGGDFLVLTSKRTGLVQFLVCLA